MKKKKVMIGLLAIFLIVALIGTNLFHIDRYSKFQKSAEYELKGRIYTIGEYLDGYGFSIIDDSIASTALQSEINALYLLLNVYDSSLSNNGAQGKVKKGVSDLGMLILAYGRLLDNVQGGADFKAGELSFRKLIKFFEPLKIEDHGELNDVDLQARLITFADAVYYSEPHLAEVIKEADKIRLEGK